MNFRRSSREIDERMEFESTRASRANRRGEQCALANGLALSESLTDSPPRFSTRRDDMSSQILHHVVDSPRSREPSRHPPLFETRRGENIHGNRDVLPSFYRSESLSTTQVLNDSQYALDGVRSQARSFDTMGQSRIDEMELLLRQQEELIMRQTARIDALRREMAIRRRIRLRQDMLRNGECDGDSRYHRRDGFETNPRPHKLQRQYEQESVGYSDRRDSSSIIHTTEYGFCSSPRPRLDIPVEGTVRRVGPRTSTSLSLNHLGERRPDLFDQLKKEAKEEETKASDAQGPDRQTEADRRARTKSVDPTKSAEQKPKRNLKDDECIPLSHPSDKAALSDYQCLIRESIELFAIQAKELSLGAPRTANSTIKAGQVGIRCRHCKHRPPHWRAQGAVYFPGSLRGVYQASQNMNANHFMASCNEMPAELREKLVAARESQRKETRRGAGIVYWLETCKSLGVEEQPDKKGLWFAS